MESSPKRIYIIGSSGSGKTTLGKLLSEKLNIPHISLDEIAYPNQIESPNEERFKHISSLANQDKWITEGIYVNWTKKLMDKADLIIWLDSPYSTTLLRVIKRFFVHKLRGDEKYGIKNTLKFIWNLRKYYYPKPGFEEGHSDKTTTRIQTKRVLAEYRNKVKKIQSSKDLKNFLENI
ncbi:hypothetical protein A3F00_00440 [Candidatus Daviesbacteria bacterium RIFCSPHIGHO2_12_FULL_37_11]|uniref:Adenylate kinase n=1 Tax=Candidatus Daviesbacteria bacterium RIFCSPHIGHO2_12_FULL_37_11 TaxID=1797777 RepID=A0A1F5KC97_9BACT|nr:MAG: hypothetical protein A2111_02360 [Candidatus Daviesbacteria bacterium GWA1_38_6]OGE17032.1 MAG: hypothetical protein A2769_03060 [Candidatus Daviesbacteria bacterium RIFCSPHIGHO2_01_FULL_37_27]OGE38440.1 MAG: hypothetical protein A3F00_00440 [Candidatus Daviesbacteria bacterium RIFCSPHIGHO2_12_FULL_37_11]OGE45989.1 MAG: hypothetical protein A3B39_04265 [Candidatus Daviesbacteria bacterium RIFCSPLOWO2_01_FULL_37_10]